MLSHASVVSLDTDQASSYVLKNTEMKMRSEQVKAIRHVKGRLCVAPYWVWQEYLLPRLVTCTMSLLQIPEMLNC